MSANLIFSLSMICTAYGQMRPGCPDLCSSINQAKIAIENPRGSSRQMQMSRMYLKQSQDSARFHGYRVYHSNPTVNYMRSTFNNIHYRWRYRRQRKLTDFWNFAIYVRPKSRHNAWPCLTRVSKYHKTLYALARALTIVTQKTYQ